MANRGDVLELKRNIGFGAKRKAERFVVLQAEAVSMALETIIVAPLDHFYDFYRAFPGAIPVSALEAGTTADQALIVTQIGATSAANFQTAPVGRLQPLTLQQADHILKIVLGLS